jgi:hypothetical protein
VIPESRHPTHPLAAFATVLWPLFIAASVLLAAFWLSGFGAGQIADPDFVRRVPNDDLRDALSLFSRGIDPVWITLAAVNIYLALVRFEGLVAARTWAVTTFLAGLFVATASASFAYPLGPVFFPTNLGPKLGPVPFAYPLLWFVVVVGARQTIVFALPRLSHSGVSLSAGLLCAALSWLNEPIAWKYRAWWLWYPRDLSAPSDVPWTSYATWFVVSTLAVYTMRSPGVVPRSAANPARPAIIMAVLTGTVAITRFVH